MLKILLERIEQKHRTSAYPRVRPEMPDRFRGSPVIDPAKCKTGCEICVEVCPTDALALDPEGLKMDLGRCLFCTDCTEACPEGAIAFTSEHAMSARSRED